MTEHSRDLVQWALGVLVSASILVGLATRYVLLPWLKDKLVLPIQQTHHQVTQNNHQSPDGPTLPDRLTDLQTDVHTLTRLLDYHVSWSENEHTRLERDLAQLALRLNTRGTEAPRHDDTKP